MWSKHECKLMLSSVVVAHDLVVDLAVLTVDLKILFLLK